MARILEALNQAERKGRAVEELCPALHVCVPEPESADLSEEVPFIEVGGARKILDASPAVLACAPLGSKLVSALPTIHAPPVSVPPEPKSKGVMFRPLTPGRLPLTPARDRLAPELIAFHQPDHPLSEGYRALLAEIQAQWAPGRSAVVLFMAPEVDAGVSTVLLNVALTAARQQGLRVVVVDGNGRTPTIARLLGLPSAPGLSEVLSGTVALSQVLQETGVENLQALTAGDDGRVRLIVEAMPVVLRHLREQFSLVLLDGPAELAAACDAVYVVAPQDQAEAPPVLDLLQTLRQRGGPVRGCILTGG
jgi:Mrp family chromosome partitioning ATPase